MLLQLIKKEILEHLMSLRFAIACVLCMVVVLASLFVRCQDFGQTQDDYFEESNIAKQEVENWDHPWRVVWSGLTIHRRPNPLKIFVRGLDDSYGGATLVASKEALHPITRDLKNVAVPLFPPIDLVAFVGLIMSLMAIVFGYDAICGEKERGTLRLVLSYSVPRHVVLLSKWIGGYVTLTVPFLLTVIVGTVIVQQQTDFALNSWQWTRLAAIVVLSLIYIATIYSLAIWISCLTPRTATSVLVLLSLWVVLVLALPNVGPHVAQALQPIANVQEVAQARSEKADEIWKKMVEEEMKAYDKEYGFEDFFEGAWWLSIDWDQWGPLRERVEIRRYYELERERDAHLTRLREFAKIDRHYSAQMDQQVRLTKWISRISPLSCLSLAVAELADAGLLQDKRYQKQLRDHQDVLCKYAHVEWLYRQQYELDNEGERPGPWNKSRQNPVPVFNYVPPAVGDYTKAVMIDGGILTGMALLFFMLSYIGFLRYDVR